MSPRIYLHCAAVPIIRNANYQLTATNLANTVFILQNGVWQPTTYIYQYAYTEDIKESNLDIYTYNGVLVFEKTTTAAQDAGVAKTLIRI